MGQRRTGVCPVVIPAELDEKYESRCLGALEGKRKRPRIPWTVKLLIGAGGTYVSFIYAFYLMEDIFHYRTPNGQTFQAAWFLQVCESSASVLFGTIGIVLLGETEGLPLRMFWRAGAAQTLAKVCSSLSLSNGLSFYVNSLAKSAKMGPVLAGTIAGGAKYELREYVHVAVIICGTAMVSAGQGDDDGPNSSSFLALFYIALSLFFDGAVAGFQKRLQVDLKLKGMTSEPQDFLFWMSMSMTFVSFLVALGIGDFHRGMDFCMTNSEIKGKIFIWAFCSAIGQVFVFYTLAHFGPLVLTTVTTTRKLISVLVSIFSKGHQISTVGSLGICIAFAGVFAELRSKHQRHHASWYSA